MWPQSFIQPPHDLGGVQYMGVLCCWGVARVPVLHSEVQLLCEDGGVAEEWHTLASSRVPQMTADWNPWCSLKFMYCPALPWELSLWKQPVRSKAGWAGNQWLIWRSLSLLLDFLVILFNPIVCWRGMQMHRLINHLLWKMLFSQCGSCQMWYVQNDCTSVPKPES